MSIRYKYHSHDGYIHTRATDTITIEEVLSYIDLLLVDISIDKPFYELVDFSGIDNFDFGYYQSDMIINKLKLLQTNKQLLGTCFVANKDVAKGMSNIFKIKGEDRGIDMQVFSTVDEAIKYIKTSNK